MQNDDRAEEFDDRAHQISTLDRDRATLKLRFESEWNAILTRFTPAPGAEEDEEAVIDFNQTIVMRNGHLANVKGKDAEVETEEDEEDEEDELSDTGDHYDIDKVEEEVDELGMGMLARGEIETWRREPSKGTERSATLPISTEKPLPNSGQHLLNPTGNPQLEAWVNAWNCLLQQQLMAMLNQVAPAQAKEALHLIQAPQPWPTPAQIQGSSNRESHPMATSSLATHLPAPSPSKHEAASNEDVPIHKIHKKLDFPQQKHPSLRSPPAHKRAADLSPVQTALTHVSQTATRRRRDRMLVTQSGQYESLLRKNSRKRAIDSDGLEPHSKRSRGRPGNTKALHDVDSTPIAGRG